MTHESCEGCRHYLGGGACKQNLEAECAAGYYEGWEDNESENVQPTESVEKREHIELVTIVKAAMYCVKHDHDEYPCVGCPMAKVKDCNYYFADRMLAMIASGARLQEELKKVTQERDNLQAELMDRQDRLSEREPVRQKLNHSPDNYVWTCPNCGEFLVYDTPKFCPKCGQAIKWED